MKNKMMITAALFCLACNGLAALDSDLLEYLFTSPSKNPYMEGYLSETMNPILTEMAITGMPCTSYLDFSMYTMFDMDKLPKGSEKYNDVLGGQLIFFQGWMIPLPEYVALPLFWGIDFATTGFGKEYQDIISVIAGGGIAVYGRFGAIAGCAGYNFIQADDDKTDVHEMLHKLQWGIFPAINADEYPLLHYFISLIDGYLRMDRDIFQASYRANVLFKNVTINLFHHDTLLSLSTFKEENWFNLDTKYSLYAGKLGLIIPEVDTDTTVFFNVTMGYRRFFDTVWNQGFYESGLYTKIVIGYYSESTSSGGIQLTVESSVKQFLKGCRIGLLASLNPSKDATKATVGGGIGKYNFDFGYTGRDYSR